MEVVFNTTIGLLVHLPGMHYMHIPAKVVNNFGGKLPIRVICTVNDIVELQGGMVNLKDGDAYITISKPLMKKAAVSLGDSIKLKLIPDTSEFGTEMPEELEALLAQDPEGNARFFQLKKSMQRYIINYVNTVKNSEKRIDRALLLIENLKHLQQGKETFREMLGLPRDRE